MFTCCVFFTSPGKCPSFSVTLYWHGSIIKMLRFDLRPCFCCEKSYLRQALYETLHHLLVARLTKYWMSALHRKQSFLSQKLDTLSSTRVLPWCNRCASCAKLRQSACPASSCYILPKCVEFAPILRQKLLILLFFLYENSSGIATLPVCYCKLVQIFRTFGYRLQKCVIWFDLHCIKHDSALGSFGIFIVLCVLFGPVN